MAAAVTTKCTPAFSPTPSRSPSPQTKVPVGDIEYSKRRRLKDILDPRHDWEDVAGELGYSQDEIGNFELDYKRPDGSPTMRLLEHLGQRNVSVNKLFVAMCEKQLNRAAEVLIPLVDSKYHVYLKNEEDPPVPSQMPEENMSEISNTFRAMTIDNHAGLSMDSLPPPPPMPPGPVSPPNVRVCQPNQEPYQPDNHNQRRETLEEAQERLKDVDRGFTLAKMPHFFYKDLEEGTKNFAEANLLGEGTYGRVFRANLFKTIFAVKCLRQNNEDITYERNGRKFQFNELAKLMQFRHPNLLPLHGYSADGIVPCLVTEYMHNGSLEDRLQCKDRATGLKWELRMNITKGVARGLQFLHTVKDPPLIHGDVKSSNILLDRHYEAKIGDFGLARDGPTGSLKSYTIMKTDSKIMGTTAYMAPEYIRNKQLSREVDTFAFGVVVFEILTGQKAFDETRGRHRMLTDLVQDSMETDDPDLTLKLADKKTGRTAWPRDTALGLFNIGQQCTLPKRKLRPKMTDVLSRLEKMEVQRQLSKEGVSLLSSSPDNSLRQRQEPQESESPSLASMPPRPVPPPARLAQSTSHEPTESDDLDWQHEDNKKAVGHYGNQNGDQQPAEKADNKPINSYPSQTTLSTDLESNGVISHQKNVASLAAPPDGNKDENMTSRSLTPPSEEDPNSSKPVKTSEELNDEKQDKESMKNKNFPPNMPVEAWTPDTIKRNTDDLECKATEKKFPQKDMSKLDNMPLSSKHSGYQQSNSATSVYPAHRKLSPCESDDSGTLAQQRQSPVEFHGKANGDMMKPQVKQPGNITGNSAALSSREQPYRVIPIKGEPTAAEGRDGGSMQTGVAGGPADEHFWQQRRPAYPPAPGYEPQGDIIPAYGPGPYIREHRGYGHLPGNELGMSPGSQNGCSHAYHTAESSAYGFYGVPHPYGPPTGHTLQAMGQMGIPYPPPVHRMPYSSPELYPQPQAVYNIPPSDPQIAYIPVPQHSPTASYNYPSSSDSASSNQPNSSSTVSTSPSQSSAPQSSVSREGSSRYTTISDTSSGLSSQSATETSSGLSGDDTSSMSLPDREISSGDSLSLPDKNIIRFSPNAARDRLMQDIEDYDEGRIDSKQCFGHISDSCSLGEVSSLEQSEVSSLELSESSRVPTEDCDDSTVVAHEP